MYPRIPWEPVVDPLESTEHIFWTSGLQRTSTHFLNKVSTFHLQFALAHRNSERKTLECTYMSISTMEGNSFCEYSITVCKQHWVLWFVVCVTCAGLQLDGLLVLVVARIVLSQHIILTWPIMLMFTLYLYDRTRQMVTMVTTVLAARPRNLVFVPGNTGNIFLFSIMLDRLWNQSVCCWLHTVIKEAIRQFDNPNVITLTYKYNEVPEWSKRSTAATWRSQLITVGAVHISAWQHFRVSSGISQQVTPYVTWDAQLL